MSHLSNLEIEPDYSINSHLDEGELKNMSDEELFYHHVVNDDHELFMLDSYLSDIFAN